MAHACGAEFVRVEGFVFAHVADEGLIESDAGELLRYRRAIGAERVRVFADIKKKHSSHAITADVDAGRDREGGRVLPRRRRDRDRHRDRRARRARRGRGRRRRGATAGAGGLGARRPANLARYAAADGFIVGSSVKQGGVWSNALDRDRVRAVARAFVERCGDARDEPRPGPARQPARGRPRVPRRPHAHGPAGRRDALRRRSPRALWGREVGCVSLRGRRLPRGARSSSSPRAAWPLDGMRPLGRPGVRTWLLYEGRVRRVVHRLGCPTHEEVSPRPEDVPDAWRARARVPPRARCRSQVQARLVRVPGRRRRPLISHRPARARHRGHRCRAGARCSRTRTCSSRARTSCGSTTRRPTRTPRCAGSPAGGCATSRSSAALKGGVLYDVRADRLHEWAARTHGVVDPTGAGDALRGRLPRRHCCAGGRSTTCLRRGVVSAELRDRGLGPGRRCSRRRRPTWRRAGCAQWFGRRSRRERSLRRGPRRWRGRWRRTARWWRSRPRSSRTGCRTPRASNGRARAGGRGARVRRRARDDRRARRPRARRDHARPSSSASRPRPASPSSTSATSRPCSPPASAGSTTVAATMFAAHRAGIARVRDRRHRRRAPRRRPKAAT